MVQENVAPSRSPGVPPTKLFREMEPGQSSRGGGRLGTRFKCSAATVLLLEYKLHNCLLSNLILTAL